MKTPLRITFITLAILVSGIGLMKFLWIFLQFSPSTSPGFQVSQEPSVLSIGKTSFTQKELDLATKFVSFSYPQDPDPQISALTRLTEGHLYASVLAELGSPITSDMLQTESERIDTSTQDYRKLDRMKAFFGSDSELYQKIAILPDYANNYFHFTVFPKLEIATKESKDQALTILAKLQAGKAVSRALKPVKFQFSLSKGFEPMERIGQKNLPPQIIQRHPKEEIAFNAQMDEQIIKEAKKYEDEVFSPLAQGEWFPRLVEKTESFDIIRWINKTSSGRTVEIVTVPKKSAFDFFDEKKKNIPIWMKDTKLRESFIVTIPWAKDLLWKKY